MSWHHSQCYFNVSKVPILFDQNGYLTRNVSCIYSIAPGPDVTFYDDLGGNILSLADLADEKSKISCNHLTGQNRT